MISGLHGLHGLPRCARSDESKQPAPLLVLAWGNLSRGDDALGPLSLAALREQLPESFKDQVEFLEDYQLQVEHALDLIGRQRVLFIDASLNCPAPFEVSQLQPAQDASFTTHTLSPQALLQVYQDMQGTPPPPCTLLAIRGEAFELGEPPSAAALAHLNSAVTWARQWLLEVL
jgi:hydrogenase maturation protease